VSVLSNPRGGVINRYRQLGQKIRGGIKRRWSVLIHPLYCPVCGSGVEAFKPMPLKYTENFNQHGFIYRFDGGETCNKSAYECPVCRASDRDRLYALYLMNYFDRMAPGRRAIRILDIAPSDALSDFIRKQIKKNRLLCEYRTVDLVREDVDDRVDIMNMAGYPDASFDFFLCSHVLEHVPDDKKAMRELLRVMRPGGEGILMVPIALTADRIDEDPSVVDPGERWRRFGQDDHVRLYSKHGFIERVKEAGFSLREFGVRDFGKKSFQSSGIELKSILYVVNKNHPTSDASALNSYSLSTMTKPATPGSKAGK